MMDAIRLGVIGMGARGAGIAALLMQTDPAVRVAVVADPDEPGARRRMAERSIDPTGCAVVPSAAELLKRIDAVDALVIATRCNLHTPIAMECLRTGLPIHLEKPVAIDERQAAALHHAASAISTPRVVVSFPLRASPMFTRVAAIVQSGRLGTINQIRAVNDVSYGGIYFGQWYRDFAVTRGLWLQKATHDFDYIGALAGAAAERVAAVGSKRVYGGDKPAGLVCSRCDETTTCPESPLAIAARGDDGGMGKADHACAFGEDVHHHDAGSAIVGYANGLHAAYSQNFVTRRTARARGAVVIGYKATLQFDWYSEQITVIEHHTQKVETERIVVEKSHHGGDQVLARNVIDVIRREAMPLTSIADGVRSARLCLAAQRSEESRQFETVTPTSGHERM